MDELKDKVMAYSDFLKKSCIYFTRYYIGALKYIESKSKDFRSVKKKMKSLPKEGEGRDIFIILNGPSLKTQDLSVLKGKDLMFVNRGFLHPLYKELQPKYHVFVDPKMLLGIWPLEWIDQIFEMCPNIRIIMPSKWHSHPHFASYKDDPRIFWQYWQIPFYVNGVSTNCFSYAISQGFNNIFFTGFDGNSCAFDMIKSSESHFYGCDPELSNMTSLEHMNALYSTFLQLVDLVDFSKYCVKRDIKIYNLTNGGILDMFVRRDFNDPYNKEKEIPIHSRIIKYWGLK